MFGDRFEFKKDPDNDMLIGPDDCHHDNEAHAMYFCMGLCGCGNPKGVHGFLVDSAKCLDTRDGWDSREGLKGVEALIKANPAMVAQFVVHFLEHNELTEHGSSVHGSWLTPRGEQFIEIGPMKDDVEK